MSYRAHANARFGLWGHGIKSTVRMRADSNPPSEELTFRDPDNILVQLQDVTYCGGEGKLGERCG